MLGNPLGGAVYFRAISAFASYGTAQLPCKFTTFFRADHNTAIFFRHIRPSPSPLQPSAHRKKSPFLSNLSRKCPLKIW